MDIAVYSPFLDLDLAAGDSGLSSFQGLAAAFGNRDAHGDIIEATALDETIAASGGKVPVYWEHDRTRPIAYGMSATPTPKGLAVAAEWAPTQTGAEARQYVVGAVERGMQVGLSVGIRVKGNDVEYDGKTDTRRIRKAQLREYSITFDPANKNAMITRLKYSADCPPTARELEDLLREQGLSRAAAKAVVAKGLAGLRDAASEEEPDPSARDAQERAAVEAHIARVHKLILGG